MSTNKDSTARDVFGDLTGMVNSSGVFDGHIEHVGPYSIRLWTPAQLAAGAATANERGLIVLSALPTTTTSARGPAVYGTLLDEAAHLGGLGPTATTTDIHRALAPAMAQFDNSFTVMCSSPWTMVGRFYETHRAACEVNTSTGVGETLDAFTMQIPSWELYFDWEQAATIDMWPDGPAFPPQRRPIISPDSRELAVARDRDPASYLVEFEGQWATVADRYLPAATVDKIFAPPDPTVTAPTYQAPHALHIDLSLSGDNSALVLAHTTTIDNAVHVIVDRIHTWDPSDYPQRQVDYDEIADVATQLAIEFDAAITVDQYQSMSIIDKITERLNRRSARGPRSLGLTPTVVQHGRDEKLTRWDLTKTTAAEGRVHAEFHKLLSDELNFLRRVDHRIEAPTSGPVTTDDVADALSHVTYALLNQNRTNRAFENLRAQGSRSPFGPHPLDAQFRAARRHTPSPVPGDPSRGIHRNT